MIGAARALSRRRMSCDLEAVATAGPVFRLARAPDPWAWPGWSQASLDGTFGNGWGDDPEGAYRVLYASSTRFGALLETLARFRPDLAVIAGLSEIEGRGNPISAGTVPREWFDNRLMGVAELIGTYAEPESTTGSTSPLPPPGVCPRRLPPQRREQPHRVGDDLFAGRSPARILEVAARQNADQPPLAVHDVGVGRIRHAQGLKRRVPWDVFPDHGPGRPP